MTFDQFLALSEKEKVKDMRRAFKASQNLANKTKMPTQKEIEILNYSIRWLGGYDIIKSWEKRIFKK